MQYARKRARTYARARKPTTPDPFSPDPPARRAHAPYCGIHGLPPGPPAAACTGACTRARSATSIYSAACTGGNGSDPTARSRSLLHGPRQPRRWKLIKRQRGAGERRSGHKQRPSLVPPPLRVAGSLPADMPRSPVGGVHTRLLDSTYTLVIKLHAC
jgi:hypothetical protein